MTYLKDYGGYLVTCSYDLNLKVWQPSNVYGDPLVGKLKGHNQPLVSCASFPNQPFVASVDQGNVVIIWDVRTFGQL
jgi:WD40 repeat protein